MNINLSCFCLWILLLFYWSPAVSSCLLPCQNGGKCITTTSGKDNCQCPSGFKGDLCQEDIDECALNFCPHAAKCDNIPGSYRCQCKHGWEGRNCTRNIDDCLSNPCQNGATCVDQVNSRYECHCRDGFIGVNCEYEDPCKNSPCHPQNTKSCISNPLNEYTCECHSGFTDNDCSVDIDECAIEGGSPCDRNGKCINTLGGYICQCPPGIQGERCEDDIRECDSNPCLNGAACLDKIGHYECICKSGFIGKNCETRVNKCLSQPCLNGGQCEQLLNVSSNTYQCTCPKGFTGLHCENIINICSNNPCQNGATCSIDINDKNKYQCKCPKGFAGTECEMNVNDCAGIVCVNNGSCIDGIDTWKCNCKPGYEGDNCEIEINECLLQPCKNGGTCKDLVNGYQCICVNGTEGNQCEININECKDNPCYHGGECIDHIGYYQCKCLSGYTGTRCERRMNICEQKPCHNNGSCIEDNTSLGYHCVCPQSYKDPHCISQTDYCESKPCKNNAKCINEVDEFRCKCVGAFMGSLCEERIVPCHTNPCQHGATCTNLDETSMTYHCACPAGYAGLNCEKDIDECSLHPNKNPCGKNGACLDFVNGYHCKCYLPWVGEHCETRLDPCLNHSCAHEAFCLPTHDYHSYTCQCKTAVGHFTGQYCTEDVNECLLSNPCLNKGECTNTKGSFVCKCQPGFVGQKCEIDVNECDDQPCLNGGQCLDLINDYQCQCPSGFQGKNCQENIDECQLRPCLNGGTCMDHINSYVCNCKSGFSGINCEINDNDCSTSSCLNGGLCIDQILGHVCKCAEGFKGSSCETEVTACDSKPCQNNGSCIAFGKIDYRCSCRRGFNGDNCERVMSLCDVEQDYCNGNGHCITNHVSNTIHCQCNSMFNGLRCEKRLKDTCATYARLYKNGNVNNICHNGGKCVDLTDTEGFFCRCPPHYDGTFCERKLDLCASMPCKNGGTCHNESNVYHCTCPDGFGGGDCEDNINECSSNPCKHGGRCIDKINDYVCICPSGTAGKQCEINHDDCLVPEGKQPKCRNGGQCVDLIGKFSCICQAGFAGLYCEADVNKCIQAAKTTWFNPLGGGNEIVVQKWEKAIGLCSPSGSLECIPGRGNFTCRCKLGYYGRFCEKKEINKCEQTRLQGIRLCHNGGECESVSQSIHKDGYRCRCPNGYGGNHCQEYASACESKPCKNGGTCRPKISSVGSPLYHCDCPPGLGGVFCEVDVRNECTTSPCINGGQCIDGPGKARCVCSSSNYCGDYCQLSGRACEVSHDNEKEKMTKFQEESLLCTINNCSQKAGNGICDEECNYLACSFDASECLLSINTIIPWQNCSIIHDGGKPCHMLFANGKCDKECAIETCLFDGWDCLAKNETMCLFDECHENYGNNHCDLQCNSSQCLFDGGDCLLSNKEQGYSDSTKPINENALAKDNLIITVAAPPNDLNLNILNKLLRSLSQLLNSIVLLEKDDNGQPVIREVTISSTSSSATNGPQMRNRRSLSSSSSSTQIGSQINLILDNTICKSQSEECFTDSSMAAQFVIASMRSKEYRPPIRILSVGSEPRRRQTGPGGLPIIVVIILLMLLLLLCVAVGVLAVITFRPRKKESTCSKDRKTFKSKVQSKGTFFPGLQGTDVKLSSRRKGKPNNGGVVGVGEHCITTENNMLLANTYMTQSTHSMSKIFTNGRSHTHTRSHHGGDPLVEHLPMLNHANYLDDPDNSLPLSVLDVAFNPCVITQQSTRETSLHDESPGNESNCQRQTLEMRMFYQMRCLLWDASQTCLEIHGETALIHHLSTCIHSLERHWNEQRALLSHDYDVMETRREFWKLSDSESGETLLHLAARFNNIAAVKLFLNSGAILDVEDLLGHTPLLISANAGAFECYQLLYNTQIYLNNANAVLDASTSSGGGQSSSESSDPLLNKSNTLYRSHRNTDGSTPLMLAIKSAHSGLIDYILNQLLNTCNSTGALHNNNSKNINVSPVAELNAVDKDGRTVLHWACVTGQALLVQRLLSHFPGQITIDAQTHQEETPLFLAVKEGHYDTCRVLLDQGGANPDLCDHVGRTPRMIAMEYGLNDIIHLLDQKLSNHHHVNATANIIVPGSNNNNNTVMATTTTATTGNGGRTNGAAADIITSSSSTIHNQHKNSLKHNRKENNNSQSRLAASHVNNHKQQQQQLRGFPSPPMGMTANPHHQQLQHYAGSHPANNNNNNNSHCTDPHYTSAINKFALSEHGSISHNTLYGNGYTGIPPSMTHLHSASLLHPHLQQQHQQQQQQLQHHQQQLGNYVLHPSALSMGLTPSPDTDSPCQLSLSPASPYRTRPPGSMTTAMCNQHSLLTPQPMRMHPTVNNINGPSSYYPAYNRSRQNSVNDIHHHQSAQFISTSFNPHFPHAFM